jgi:hypothetical protein
MSMTTWKVAAALALSVGLAASCRAGVPEGAADLAAWLDRRVQDWQPTAEERRLDDIGWAHDIREAERLAAAHNRPVFLFTYDGASLATYRC